MSAIMTLILMFTGRPCVIGRFGELTKLAFLVSIVVVFFVSCAGGFKDISTPGPEVHAENDSLVKKFAPLLKFDRAAASYGYPMDAQEFYEKWKKYEKGYFKVENTDKKTLTSKKNPTYYQLRIFGNQVRIMYWWFYGYQHQCTDGKGYHHGDWERVMVILTENRRDIAAVTFWQHDAHYTRISGPRDAPCTPAWTDRCRKRSFERIGTHPVVYVGKIAHGSYHDKNDLSGHTYWGCTYYGDFRNPESHEDFMETWHNLIDLHEPKLKDPKNLPISALDYGADQSPLLENPTNFRISGLDSSADQSPLPERNWKDEKNWIDADRIGSWDWGPDGCGTHPTRQPPTAKMRACEGNPAWDMGEAASAYDNGPGCYKSECLSGDDQAIERCLKECEPGYTNHGLTCGKIGWAFWEWSVYGRLNPGKSYKYDYILPTQDAGLARRRSKQINIREWGLPFE